MDSETDLSTADLARPGGAGAQDRADDEHGRGVRTDGTAGHRVADDPAGRDVGTWGGGSTREDAIRADEPYADRAGAAEVPARDMPDRGMAEREAARGTAGRGPGAGGDVALLDAADAEGFRRRWSDTQAHFVDDPREAVQTADGLVAELMQVLARSFDRHRGELEAQWQRGGDPGTEELRQALQRYRSFFDRLLSA